MTDANAFNPWRPVVRDYLDSLRAAGRRPMTVRLHEHYLRHLQRFARDPLKITVRVLERALAARRDWTPETIRSAASVFRGLTKWLHARGLIPTDPGLLLPAVRVPPGVARPIPDPILDLLLTAHLPGRSRWLLLLGGHCGLRVGEMALVHSNRLDGDLLFVVGKGGKERWVPVLDPDLQAAIRSAGGWLFPGRQDGHLSPGYVSKLLSELLPEHWTAHTLRHRAGTAAYRGTRDILAVGRLLGHAKPETTMRYIQLPMDSLYAVARAAA
ncbi:tyrosine-type recombinase/integrase [Promicromonospora kroppenstedtii]|uniref:tyrosine-type recombinase/integrase n=1 Tax=Promicromonospora kroppenstedtii TaxID=440482 RepID=UPI000A0033F5|nr:tyrosine-type recombinase/integrase [Promicromonospora kroppenstedtii]